MMKRYFLYGCVGLGLEVLWTSLLSLINGDYTLSAATSLLMLPIYGTAVLLEPVFILFKRYYVPFFLRGFIYALLIFFVEYAAGGVYTLLGICPWNYYGAAYSVNGLIRLDYAPLWTLAGLLYERIYFKCFWVGV